MNLNKNWKTNSIGAAIILSAIVSVFIGKSDWAQAGIIMTIGAGFFVSKDHTNGS